MRERRRESGLRVWIKILRIRERKNSTGKVKTGGGGGE
jgi:hypothetical protein